MTTQKCLVHPDEAATFKDAAKVQIVEFGSTPITIKQILDIANGNAKVALCTDAGFRKRINSGATFIERLLKEGATVYGVNTGYGDSCTVLIPADLVDELPLQLTRYHGCGLGRELDAVETRSVLACRLASLCQGYSGVRMVLLEQLASLINQNILPCIPAEGSVGASGDLTPLSYVAAALIGEREVIYQGKRQPAATALKAAGVQPLLLKPKEGLALMNGTAVMTGLACLAVSRADYLSRISCRLTALASVAMQGNREHFDPRLFAVKPHAGQIEAAGWIWRDLQAAATTANDDDLTSVGTAATSSRVIGPRLQDRYSIRCAPHVVGVLRDALRWIRSDVENEINSANDNPIIDGIAEEVMHGGHFYGGHIAFAMDSLKTAVANLADLQDRQLALMVDVCYNQGLPRNLSGVTGRRAAINHGFKAVQIGVSAWTAEALKMTMPASVFSRSTECHNQDKVSMGTIAARDCLRVLELTEQVTAAVAMAANQAVTLRERIATVCLSDRALQFCTILHEASPWLEEDRALDYEIRAVIGLILAQKLPLY